MVRERGAGAGRGAVTCEYAWDGQVTLAQMGTASRAKEMVNPHPHRPVHRKADQLGSVFPVNLSAFAGGRRRPADGTGGEDDRELLPRFSVAGVQDDVPRVGVDADRARDP